jgi:hypothetical protein
MAYFSVIALDWLAATRALDLDSLPLLAPVGAGVKEFHVRARHIVHKQHMFAHGRDAF